MKNWEENIYSGRRSVFRRLSYYSAVCSGFFGTFIVSYFAFGRFGSFQLREIQRTRKIEMVRLGLFLQKHFWLDMALMILYRIWTSNWKEIEQKCNIYNLFRVRCKHRTCWKTTHGKRPLRSCRTSTFSDWWIHWICSIRVLGNCRGRKAFRWLLLPAPHRHQTRKMFYIIRYKTEPKLKAEHRHEFPFNLENK